MASIVSLVKSMLLLVLAIYSMLSYTFLYCYRLIICFNVFIATGDFEAITRAVPTSPSYIFYRESKILETSPMLLAS